MASTQHLLPTVPTAIPFIRPHYHPYSHSFPLASRPSAPPASPRRLHSSHARLQRELPTRGVLQEASTACDKVMRLAHALERRANAERRLSRKNRPRPPLVSVMRPAAPSTVPAVGDDIPCREATVHRPQPSAPTSLNLSGLLSDVPLPRLSLPFDHVLSCSPPPRTFVDKGTEPLPDPTSCDVGVDVLPPRAFSDAAVGDDDGNTMYGLIADRFARDLARLLPWNHGRERALARTVWLDDWEAHITIFEKMPPFLRLYLHTLFMLFRPGAHPAHRNSIPPAFAPAYNFFAHWGSAWNALETPYGPPEEDIRCRYYYLTHAQINGTAPLEGRGFILEHASSFS
ncbi:hypothetical protein DFH09DRAFT_1091276 [Mycena vulgaris]|nr:hypothetical protein DFH09DRAFT_1091276 [Mycena vulgaris]